MSPTPASQQMDQQTELKFSLGPEKEFVLSSAPGVFTPTGTTKLLIKGVLQSVSHAVRMLDLGCGTGIVGLSLYLQGLVKPPLCASDLSASAVRCTRMNFERYGCPGDVRAGSLYEPWAGEKFDVIVDDISGVAQDIAALSPWFQGIPCETGRDGTALVVDILRNARDYLSANGRLFFPALSLSNVDVLLEEARTTFSTVERIARQEWPLPEELKAHMPVLEKLNQEGCITLKERFGIVLYYTEIYCATIST